MLRTLRRSSTVLVALIGIMALGALGIDYARAQIRQNGKAQPAEGDFMIYDTPQATLLLDRGSGDLWRIGYTEVAGNRYWFSTYIPREPQFSFADFQSRLRKEIRSAPRDKP